MAAADNWTAIHGERNALVADVEGLNDEQWATPSLCAEWSVRDVLAHMVATAKMTPPRFVGQWAGSGFQFNKMNQKGMAAELGNSPADTLAAFKAELSSTKHPPGPLEAMVAESVIHGEDLRRPLGIAHTYPPEMLVTVGDFVTKGNLLLGGKRRATGLSLRATDVEWSKGAGPEVSGPMASIIVALTGRKAGLGDLSGEGVETLKQRI